MFFLSSRLEKLQTTEFTSLNSSGLSNASSKFSHEGHDFRVDGGTPVGQAVLTRDLGVQVARVNRESVTVEVRPLGGLAV